MKKVSFWFVLALVILAGSFVVQALAYDAQARLFPLLIGIPTTLAGIWVLSAEIWPNSIKIFDVKVGSKLKNIAKGIEADSEETPEEVKALGIGTEEKQHEEVTDIQKRNRIMICAAWMAGYFVVIWLAGFIVADFLLPAAYIKVHAKSRWYNAVIIAALTSFIIWVSFDYAMKTPMFNGILFGEMMPPW